MRAFLLLLLIFSNCVFARQITDLDGRQVEIPDNPQRIVLGESRMLYTLALLEPGYPAAKIVGWPADLAKYDAQTWSLYQQKFPQINQITQLGSGSVRELNAESVLKLTPDLVILPRLAKTGNEEAAFRQLMQQAGIPVITIDLRVDLLNNTVPSIKILGEVLNQQQRARDFIAFYQQHMERIRQRIADYQGPKTRVMLHLHLGRRDTCCTTAVNGNLGQLLAFAGGDNIAAPVVKGVFGELNQEAVLAANPQVYIATGMAGPAAKAKTLQLGPQVSAQQAQQSFRQIMQAQPIISQLAAVRQGRAWDLWHNFYLNPYHVVATEFFAKALYPQLFADVDPQQTMQQLYQQFLPLDFSGTFWSQLPQ
ncbi:iron complex transport system substrate-binding protein [Erwinia toletana]|uniref:Iron complex transport system substrate-binding protein n=1 Tax=Winslowiella toletana TaxID=92490 RepID=A0ABS4P9Q0_9GAMM|nr:ABC transporter substrate-binding protein [Winslowiella toletana]MBP2168850.1 iron complex transport system substrate-binding protein [Winslowiella toletana]